MLKRKFKEVSKEDLFSLVGAVLYLVQLWISAHTISVRLDESAYIYKGYLFATGEYTPFGPDIWTNKAPFAFLIPGYVQAWFGPGLRPARYFGILVGFLILFGVWFTARRLGGKKWGTAVVWLFVLTPAMSKIYSPALSQGIVALMLTGVLALSLGGDRPIWQLSLSAALAGLMLLTRQNMVLVLPILTLFIFWQYGRKAGFYALFSGATVVIIGHLYWWPQIMSLWTPWLPGKLAIPIRSLYLPPGSDIGSRGGSFSPVFSSRILAFFFAFRTYMTILVGIMVSLILWKKKWTSQKKFRDAVFLLSLYLILFLMHAWASLGKNYCVYCFPSYLAFFNVGGILLIVISAPSWKKEVPKYLYPLIIILILTITTGIGFSASEDIRDTLLKIQIPRMKDGHFLSGNVELSTLLFNKFHLGKKLTSQYFSTAMGFTVGVFFLLSTIVAKYTFLRKKEYNFGYLFLISFFLFSFIAPPIIARTDPVPDYYQNDIIYANEEVGDYLSHYIPAGSTVYWKGGNSLIPLLYIPGGVKIYPTQLNAYNNIKNGGDPKILLSLGLWNTAIDNQRKAEADYIVIINYVYDSEWKSFLASSQFEELPPSSTLLEYNPDSFLRIFRRK